MSSTGRPPAGRYEGLYDEEYYTHHCGPKPYVKGDPEWTTFFEHVAENIIRGLAPRTVFDAGCALGFLVESLWDRSVQAHGRDISKFAIGQVRADVRDCCEVGSITEPVEGRYDLVVCLEVLEHLSEPDALLAIRQLTQASDRVLFSSSPIDFEEPTHINVRPPLYWLRQFARVGFRPVLSFDATFVCAWAFLFERSAEGVGEEHVAAAAELIRIRVQLHQERQALDESRRTAGELAEKLDHLQNVETDYQAARRALGRQAELTEHAERRVAHLEHALDEQIARAVEAETLAAVIQQSFYWRLTSPVRWIGAHLPGPVRRLTLRLLRGAWRILRLKPLRSGRQKAPADASADRSAHAEPIPPISAIRQWLPHLETLRVFRTVTARPCVTFVLDSKAGAPLDQGMGTVAILAALTAREIDADLRVISRGTRGDPSVVMEYVRLNGIDFKGVVDLQHTGADDRNEIPIGDDDVFLTSSWATTMAGVKALGAHRVVYVVQDDERMLYPYGDDRLRCMEVLRDPTIRLVVSSEPLFHHLAHGPEPVGDLANRAHVFEPAFPAKLFHDDPYERDRSGKLNFLLAGAPGRHGDLFWRGVEALELAVYEGVIDPQRTRFLFAGDGPLPMLPGSPECERQRPDDWALYAGMIRSAHVGLCLRDTPHPTHALLQLVASGSVAVTNAFGDDKRDLSIYSRNITSVDAGTKEVVEGIARALRLRLDPAAVESNYRLSGIERDWEKALASTVAQIRSWTGA